MDVFLTEISIFISVVGYLVASIAGFIRCGRGVAVYRTPLKVLEEKTQIYEESGDVGNKNLDILDILVGQGYYYTILEDATIDQNVYEAVALSLGDNVPLQKEVEAIIRDNGHVIYALLVEKRGGEDDW